MRKMMKMIDAEGDEELAAELAIPGAFFLLFKLDTCDHDDDFAYRSTTFLCCLGFETYIAQGGNLLQVYVELQSTSVLDNTAWVL